MSEATGVCLAASEARTIQTRMLARAWILSWGLEEVGYSHSPFPQGVESDMSTFELAMIAH
ncbi:MAG TPA: hypothetical protein VJ123_07290 [Anaerolineales bacterium]|nr:hypothetical protein [Anaerolineales bacterium]